MSPGEALLDVPMPDLIQKMGLAIAEAQLRLDQMSGRVASLHASWTQWKNLFSFEVFGETGYLIVEGLGGSYGREQLIVGQRPTEFGSPAEERFEFDEEDCSWAKEWEEFTSAIRATFSARSR